MVLDVAGICLRESPDACPRQQARLTGILDLMVRCACRPAQGEPANTQRGHQNAAEAASAPSNEQTVQRTRAEVRALGKLLGSTTLVLDVLKCGNVNPYDMGTFLSEKQDDHPIEAALYLNLQAEKLGGWQAVRNSVLNAAGSPQCPRITSRPQSLSLLPRAGTGAPWPRVLAAALLLVSPSAGGGADVLVQPPAGIL